MMTKEGLMALPLPRSLLLPEGEGLG
jgi:hypothetical protein